MPPPSNPLTIPQSYRHIYKTALLAIRHSKPARYTLRDRLRRAYRTQPSTSFSAPHILRTLEFLSNAARYKGLEEKIVRNFLFVWGARMGERVPAHLRNNDLRFRNDAYAEFDRHVDELNKSMGLCIM